MTLLVIYVSVPKTSTGLTMKILMTTLFLISLNVNAELIFSKTLFLQPEQIEEIENKVRLAKNRPADAMEYPTFYFVGKNLSVFCPPKLPKEDGLGCSLSIQLGEIQGTKITIRKDLNILGISEKIKTKLGGLDPSQTTDHIHFGSIFTKETAEGSHYFCYANETKDSWKCELFLKEGL